MRTFVNIATLWTFCGKCCPAFPSSFLPSSFQRLFIDFLVKHHMLLIATKANQVPSFFFVVLFHSVCFFTFHFSNKSENSANSKKTYHHYKSDLDSFSKVVNPRFWSKNEPKKGFKTYTKKKHF